MDEGRTDPEEKFTEAVRILGEWMSQRAAGEAGTFEALLERHPALDAELRQLWRQVGEVERAFDDDAVRASKEAERGRTILRAIESRGGFSELYAIEAEIGRGGMGAILRVKDRRLGRSLAMKVILGQTDPARANETSEIPVNRLQRFLNEARITGQLDHPGIVPVHEVGVDESGRAYFTMKLVKGMTLSDVFRKRTRGDAHWSTARVLDAIQRVCEALAFAHDRHTIHRDLKPDNVMVGDFGEVYVMDWGLARRMGDAPEDPAADSLADERLVEHWALTREGHVIGTPAYMSPEQARGAVAEIGPASDVYAIGAMIYQLVAGHPPYLRDAEERVSGHEIVTRIAAGPPAALTDPSFPAELVAICATAMAYRPADRYPSVSELAADLRRLLEGRVVRAYATGPWAEARKWVGRNRLLAAALATLLVGGTGASVFTASQRTMTKVAQSEALDRSNKSRRLADARIVRELEARAESLWPAWPDLVPEMTQWIETARDVVGRLEIHRQARDALRKLALPAGTPATDPATVSFVEKRRRNEVERRREDLDLLEPFLAKRIDQERTARSLSLSADARAKSDVSLASLESQRRSVADERSDADAPVAWRFADEETRWWHEQLTDLVDALERLVANDPEPPEPFLPAAKANVSIARMQRRIEHAAWVERVSWKEHREAWEAAIDRIPRNPTYAGLRLSTQLGLVPIGPDPKSGLEEFWCVETGVEPEHDGDGGSVRMHEETGIVLVLIPGGEFLMGADSVRRAGGAPTNYDPFAEEDEEPAHLVALAPYFLSKFEMTQEQWLRVAGSSQCWFSASGFAEVVEPTNPVETVSWTESARVASRIGLRLPTEAQWERAARGGTTTVWWSGDDKKDVAKAGNVADQSLTNSGFVVEAWNDGQQSLAPVGSFLPNPFGLYDVIGNVWEWCEDERVRYPDAPARPGDGLRVVARGAGHDYRVNRGGGWHREAVFSRSAYRNPSVSSEVGNYLGLRPARSVTN